MNQYTNEQISEKYKNLPKGLQNAITSVSTTDIIQAVGKKYNLPVDKMGGLEEEVGFLMIGFTRPKDFVANLAKRLGTDSETTKKIAEEINAQIFSKVKESLKKIHSVEEAEIIPSAPAAIPIAPEPKTPFEQKLEEKVFKPGLPAIVKEVLEAKKENRYPDKADPYKEPPKEI